MERNKVEMKKKILLIITMMLNLVFVFSYDWKGRIVVFSYKNADKNNYDYSYVIQEYFDTMQNGDRNLLIKRYPMLIKKAGPDLVLEKNCEWYESSFSSDIAIARDHYEGNKNDEFLCIDNCTFYIENISENNTFIELSIVLTDYGKQCYKYTEIDWPYMEDIESVHKIILKFDGDFIYVYVNNMTQLFHVYCKMYEQDRIRFNKCMATNNFDDLSEVIWPHHADGTSEYEDTIRYPDPIVIEEPEVIEVEEYVDETENSNNQSEKQQTRLEWLKENDQERYELEMYEIECMHKRERREKILKIVIPSSIVFVVFGIIFIILKKKKKSAK